MVAEIIAIGDELLIGQIVNSNAAWIAKKLNLNGISVVRLTTVGDTGKDIITALSEASYRADIILCTGGLGPTKDDITKQTICKYFDTRLRFDEKIFNDVKRIFEMRKLPMIEINRKQAEVPEKCVPLRNRHGTAPGMWLGMGAAIYVFMPGVPYEMQAMMDESVIPRLKKITSQQNKEGRGGAICHLTVLTSGIGESFLSEKISVWENNLPQNIRLAYLPSPGMVKLRLSAKGDNLPGIKAAVRKEVKKLQSLIPKYIFGYDNDTLEGVIGKLLYERRQTLSTAESCTGGYISHRITSVPGSSEYFMGSIVSYSDEIKKSELNISGTIIKKYGAVSEQVVLKMAASARKKFKTDYSIACSGIAGPSGGTKSKPVGFVWIAMAAPEKIIAKQFQFGDNRERNIHLTAMTGLNMLRKELINRGINH